MNLTQALAVVAKIKGARVWDPDYPHGEHKEALIPHGCLGRPGTVICTGEVEEDGGILCEVCGWSESVYRQVVDIVLPRGLSRTKLARAVKVLAESME